MDWYVQVLENYAVFSGRATRQEYWMFNLINFIIAIVVIVIDNLFGITFKNSFYGWLYVIYSLLIIIPSWAVTVRRLHDVDKSGWWAFITLIPILGGLYLLFLLVSDSDPYQNEYGPNPKEELEETPTS